MKGIEELGSIPGFLWTDLTDVSEWCFPNVYWLLCSL
jgi:hypothetical protein